MLLIRILNLPWTRNSFEILKYCIKHAPDGCSIIGYSGRGLPCKDSDLDNLACDGRRFLLISCKFCSSGVILHTKNTVINVTDNHSSVSKLSSSANALSSLQKFFASRSKGDKRQSVSVSICENSSPRAVLYGPEPEGGSPAAEDLSSPSGKGTRRRSNSNIWRRLSMIKLLFPSFSSSDSTAKDTDASSSYFEDQKPSWRCFSYEEIANATNNFHHGKEEQSNISLLLVKLEGWRYHKIAWFALIVIVQV